MFDVDSSVHWAIASSADQIYGIITRNKQERYNTCLINKRYSSMTSHFFFCGVADRFVIICAHVLSYLYLWLFFIAGHRRTVETRYSKRTDLITSTENRFDFDRWKWNGLTHTQMRQTRIEFRLKRNGQEGINARWLRPTQLITCRRNAAHRTHSIQCCRWSGRRTKKWNKSWSAFLFVSSDQRAQFIFTFSSFSRQAFNWSKTRMVANKNTC